MARTNEEVRHALYEALRASHGDKVANTLMELLPPVGWADVATKRDLSAHEERMDLRLETLEARVGEQLEAAIRHETNRFLVGMVSIAGLSLSIAQALSLLG